MKYSVANSIVSLSVDAVCLLWFQQTPLLCKYYQMWIKSKQAHHKGRGRVVNHNHLAWKSKLLNACMQWCQVVGTGEVGAWENRGLEVCAGQEAAFPGYQEPWEKGNLYSIVQHCINVGGEQYGGVKGTGSRRFRCSSCPPCSFMQLRSLAWLHLYILLQFLI